MAHRRIEREKLIDDVYKRRGWDKNGVPTRETVERLGIGDPKVIELMEPYWRTGARS